MAFDPQFFASRKRGSLGRAAAMKSRATASTAVTSLPSTSAAPGSWLSARAFGPEPAASASVRVVTAKPLSSQTTSTGSR